MNDWWRKSGALGGAVEKLDQPARHPIVSQLTPSPSFFIVDHTSEKLFTGSKFVGEWRTHKKNTRRREIRAFEGPSCV